MLGAGIIGGVLAVWAIYMTMRGRLPDWVDSDWATVVFIGAFILGVALMG